MKFASITLAICFMCLVSCQKDCDTSQMDNCIQELPEYDDITCTAVFSGWFYDIETKSCIKLSYSGCSPMGFETKEECEACICND